MVMTIAELLQKRAAVADEARSILNTAEEANRNLTEEERAAYDAKLNEVEELGERIERQRKLYALELEKPPVRTEVNKNGADNPTREKGDAVSRMVRSLAAAKGSAREAAHYCEQTIHDAEIARALAAGSGSAGGFIVPEQYSAELIELLYPASAVRRMGARVIPMPGGNLTLPKLTGGATAAYVGENSNMTKTEQTFGQLKLSAKKLAALVPISNDLIRFSSPSADAIVRADLIQSIATKEDSEFLRGDGLGLGPKGLRHWAPAANVLAVNATVNLANVTTDLGKLELALMGANVRMIQPGWIMAPRTRVYLENLRDSNGNVAFPEIAQGRLKGYPFAMTTQIPVNLAVTGTGESEIYFVDFADVVIGEVPGLILDVSSEAAYYDGSAVVSSFSQDQTVIRVIVQHDLGMRHDASVAVLKDVDWA